MTILSEEQILARDCKRGNKEAQRKVFEKYYGLMLAICIRYSNNREVARDLLQDGFIKIFEKIEQFDESFSFIGWMKRIMVNNAIDHYRKNARNPKEDDEVALINKTSDDDVISDISYKEILKCIQLLPNGYRTIFNMYVIEGYTHKEIADLLGIAEGTSKSQLNKAKAILRKKIEELRNYNTQNEDIEQYG